MQYMLQYIFSLGHSAQITTKWYNIIFQIFVRSTVVKFWVHFIILSSKNSSTWWSALTSNVAYLESGGQENSCWAYPCLNGGTCQSYGAQDYMCYCYAGYSGINCEQSKYIMQCFIIHLSFYGINHIFWNLTLAYTHSGKMRLVTASWRLKNNHILFYLM